MLFRSNSMSLVPLDIAALSILHVPSLGAIDASTVTKVVKEVTEEEKRRLALMDARPPLENVLNMHDFENVAKMVLPDKAWVRARSEPVRTVDLVAFSGILFLGIG